MEVCIGELHGKPMMLSLKDGIAYINGEEQPIKNLTEDELEEFQKEIDLLPKGSDPGYAALVDSVRASFIARLLGQAVGDECINLLTHILDHVHYNVLQYLDEDDNG